MDRIDLPSEEVAEQMAEDCLDMIGKAIAARDAEWVGEIDRMLDGLESNLKFGPMTQHEKGVKNGLLILKGTMMESCK